MPTKPRTKKPAKATRKPRKPKPTAEDIGRSIGDALGRRLESLLAKPDNPGFDAVSAWTVEKLGDGANYATKASPARISPVEESLNRLRAAITSAEIITDAETERLCAALSPPHPESKTDRPSQPGAGVLACVLNDMAERIYEDNRRRNELLDRLEL